MKTQLTPFERYMRNQLKKEKAEKDQIVLDEIHKEMKDKYESEKQMKIDKLEKELEKLK